MRNKSNNQFAPGLYANLRASANDACVVARACIALRVADGVRYKDCHIVCGGVMDHWVDVMCCGELCCV